MTESKNYVIRKGGFFYRDNRAGYTGEVIAAGLYTKAEAEEEAAVEPNNIKAVPLSFYALDLDMITRLVAEKQSALTHPEAQGNKDLGEPAASGLEEEAQLAAVKFAHLTLDAYWPDCNDIDGSDIQSLGIKSGVMQEVPGGYDPEKHGESIYDAEPGDTWYVAHPGLKLLLQAALAAAPTSPQPIKGDKTEALSDAATVQAMEGL